MSSTTDLQKRIEAEFTGARDRASQQRQALEVENREREQRLAQFTALLDRLRGIWQPRLELLRQRFTGLAKAEPEVKPYSRSIAFHFPSDKYKIDLTFSATPDRDVRALLLDSDLLIIPVLIKYDRHASLEVPIDRVDEAAVGRWLDDQILAFVRTYVALQGDDFVLKNLASK